MWKEEFDRKWKEISYTAQDDELDRLDMKDFISTEIIQKIIDEYGGFNNGYGCCMDTNLTHQLEKDWL